MPSYQLIFFVIALVCSLPVLYWYYRRHAHSRFRPKVGEMAMVALFAVLLSLGGAMLIGGLMDDPEQFRHNDMGAMPAMPGGAGAGELGDDREGGKGSSSRSDSGSRDKSGRDGGGGKGAR